MNTPAPAVRCAAPATTRTGIRDYRTHRTRQRGLAIISLVVSVLTTSMVTTTPAHAAEATAADSSYKQLPRHKARAELVGDTSINGVASQQANEAAAASQALADCNFNKGNRAGACELVRLNNSPVITAAEIRRRAATANPKLFLWEFKRPASPQQPAATVYVAGSVHVLKESLYPLHNAYTQAFACADTMAVEVDLNQYPAAQLQAQTLKHVTLPEGTTLDSLLSAPLRRKVAAEASRMGIPIEALAGLKPAFVMQQILVYHLTTLGYSPAHGVEQYFQDMRASHTPAPSQVAQLESLDQQLRLLFDQPLDLQVALLEETLLQLEELDELLAELVAAWLQGDEDAFLQMFLEQSGKSAMLDSFNLQLLDQRNTGMAEKIGKYLDRGGRYFVLIGAAHLVGEQGVIALLQRAGYSGRRVGTDGVSCKTP